MRTLTSLILLLTLTACQTPEPELTEEGKEQLAKNVIQEQTALYEGLSNSLDPEFYDRTYERGATFVSDGVVFTLEERKADWPNVISGFQSFVWLDQKYEATVLSPSLVLLTMTGRQYAVDTLGVHGDTVATAVTTVWRETNGEWRRINYHESYPD